MRGKHIAVFISICATPVVAQVPDYLGHQEQFEYAAVMLTSTESCKNFEMQVDGQGILNFAKRAVTEAVKGGIDVKTANGLSLAALEREQERQDYILNDAKARLKNDSGARDEFLEYWGERCIELSRDSRSAAFFLLPAR